MHTKAVCKGKFFKNLSNFEPHKFKLIKKCSLIVAYFVDTGNFEREWKANTGFPKKKNFKMTSEIDGKSMLDQIDLRYGETVPSMYSTVTVF